MTELEIIEIMIRACETDRKLPNTARPATMKAMNLGYIHSFADMNQWGEARLKEAAWAWLEPENLRVTRNDVGLWLAAMELVKLAGSDKQRRALWAWARSKAGGQPFARWCRDVEHIAPHTGDMRKNRAISRICAHFVRDGAANTRSCENGGWTKDPEIRDKTNKIEVWRADDAKPACSFDESLQDFSWANAMNERRRQREAQRRKAA